MLIVMQNDPAGRPAQAARRWFADNGPPDLQPLPLGYTERERLKHGGADHILAWYARSLDGRNYDVLEHPSFDDYARGVMASEFCPFFIKAEDETGELRRRFPPRQLDGLGPGLWWLPPKLHAKVMASYRRTKAREAEIAKEVQQSMSRRTHLTSIDQSAKIPDAVKRAAALAESHYKRSPS